MDANTVESMVRTALSDTEVSVEGAGANYDILVVGRVFEGMRELKRQQTVYASIRDAIAAGTIHAVNIRALTPAERDAQAS